MKYMKIAVSGVPGTGKTKLCSYLKDEGFQTVNLNMLAENLGCLMGEEVDIDCLNVKFKPESEVVMDGHYSHLMDPFCVIITECSGETLRKRLEERGYGENKIRENMDVLLFDSIYDESLEYVPSNRILKVSTERPYGEEDLRRIRNFINKMEEKFNGS